MRLHFGHKYLCFREEISYALFDYKGLNTLYLKLLTFFKLISPTTIDFRDFFLSFVKNLPLFWTERYFLLGELAVLPSQKYDHKIYM